MGIRDRMALSWDTMRSHPSGFAGLFLLPIVVLGVLIATDASGQFVNGAQAQLAHILQSSGYCAQTFYVFPYLDNLNFNVAVIQFMCQGIQFNVMSFFLWYIQLVVLFFVAMLVILQFDFIQSRIN